MQGLNLTIQTTSGNINTDSTYCDESLFVTENGDLNLENIHKHININIEQGNLNIGNMYNLHKLKKKLICHQFQLV